MKIIIPILIITIYIFLLFVVVGLYFGCVALGVVLGLKASGALAVVVLAAWSIVWLLDHYRNKY